MQDVCSPLLHRHILQFNTSLVFESFLVISYINWLLHNADVRTFTIYRRTLHVTSQLADDGHNRWPKYAGAQKLNFEEKLEILLALWRLTTPIGVVLHR